MEINPFILALSKTLPESCLQGLAIYLLLQLYFFIDKRSTPLLKFKIYYAANLCLFAGFMLTFFHHYQPIQVASFKPDFFPEKIGNNVSVVITKPNLWFQLSFWTNHYAYLISGFYLMGLLFCMLKLAIGLINISWFRSNKNLKLDDYLTKISIQLSSNFRLIKTVLVFVSDKISVPLTIGFIKPIIVFPVALLNQLSVAQTEAILLHELAHIKRNDYLLNLLLCIIQSFLFFNPAIWLMRREIDNYREQCCDDLVLDNTQHKIAYARALLLIEESRNTQLTLALASNGKKFNLLNRIKRITNMKTNPPSPQNKFVVLLLALIVLGLTVAWNLPVKKVVKHSVNQHFEAIKEARDTSKLNVVPGKILFASNYKSNKKINVISNKRIIVDAHLDTTIKSKNKFKIVLEDSLGNKKEYNSVEELPADEQKEFLKENGKLDKLHSFKYLQNTDGKFQAIPELNDTSLSRKLNDHILKNAIYSLSIKSGDPQWKKQGELMSKQGEELRKQSALIEEQAHRQFDMPEFRAKIDKLQEEGKAIGEQARKQFDTPEFKSKIEKLRVESFQDKKINAEMLKYYQSPQWKKQQKKIKKEIEKSQKQWRKSYDQTLKPALSEKAITPQY